MEPSINVNVLKKTLLFIISAAFQSVLAFVYRTVENKLSQSFSLSFRKQNNATNNLLDFSEFDAFSTNNVMLNATHQPTAATEFEQILDLSSVPTTGKISNEDNVNSNVMNNGPAPPFIAFQENMAKKTDSNSVTGK
jgi:hypothetical protein